MTNNNDDVIYLEDLEITPAVILEARHRLWHMGELSWKLDETQLTIYNFVHNSKNKVLVINCSRRLGKSFLLAIMAIEKCLKNPKSVVKMLQPEQKMVRMNIRPIMDKIFRDCPDDIRPEFKTQDNIYVFKNGSELQLAGTDNGNHEKLRGGDSDLNLVDEAGFCSDLKYIVNSILTPTTLLTKGKIILCSTTPPNPQHEFIKYMEMATENGTMMKKTIYDAVEENKYLQNPRITMEIVEDIIKTYPGGAQSDEFRTEFMCEVIFDSELSIFPEFKAVEEDAVSNWIRPAFYDRYVSMDIGFKDLTFVLFAYYDFDNAVTVIEDEIVISGPKMTTEYLAKLIKDKEKELWYNSMTGEQYDPYRRVCDNNLIVINDLTRLHNLHFVPTLKDNKRAQVNNARIKIGNRQVIINPKCKNLIMHIKNGTWKPNSDEFARSGDMGHYDGCDALVYLLRNVDQFRNPYPKGYQHSKLGRHADLFYNPHYVDPKKGSGWNKLAEQSQVKSTINRRKK